MSFKMLQKVMGCDIDLFKATPPPSIAIFVYRNAGWKNKEWCFHMAFTKIELVEYLERCRKGNKSLAQAITDKHPSTIAIRILSETDLSDLGLENLK